MMPAHATSSRDLLLDVEHLRRQTLGDEELSREVLDLFCRQSGIMLSRLQAPRGGEDVKQAAHTLKGSARAIGAWAVAREAEAVEAAGLGLDVTALARVVDETHAVIADLVSRGEPPANQA